MPKIAARKPSSKSHKSPMVPLLLLGGGGGFAGGFTTVLLEMLTVAIAAPAIVAPAELLIVN